LGLVQRRGIGDALTPVLRGEGIDEQMGRTDEPLLHGGGRLDHSQVVHQVLIDAAPELDQRFGQDKMGLRVVRLDLAQATGVHHRHIGAQAVTHVVIGLAPLVLQQFQGQQHAGRYRRTAPRGALCGKASGNALLDGLDHRVPWEGIGPQAHGMGLGDKLGSLEVRTASDEPVLKVAQDTHGGSPFYHGGVRASGYDEIRSETTPQQRVE